MKLETQIKELKYQLKKAYSMLAQLESINSYLEDNDIEDGFIVPFNDNGDCDSTDQYENYIDGLSNVVEQWISGSIITIGDIDDLAPIARVDGDEEELLEILDVKINDMVDYDWLYSVVDDLIYCMNDCFSGCKEKLIESYELSEDEFTTFTNVVSKESE